MSTFVTVGTMDKPFGRLLDEVNRMAAEGALPAPVFVQSAGYEVPQPAAQFVPFIAMEEFEERLQKSQLVITHGGVTALQAVRYGKVPVVVPRQAGFDEHINDHQVEFASQLAKNNTAIVVLNIADLRRSVEAALDKQLHSPAAKAEESELVREVRRIIQEAHAKP